MNKNKFLLQLKNIKPTPKWVFIFKTILFLLLFILFIFIGVISTSLIIYSIFNTGFDIDKTNINDKLKILLSSLPYIWILITIGFFAIAYFNFKNTENGYKYLTKKNILLTFIGSIILGLFLYNIGFSEILDNKFQDTMPIYKNYTIRHMQYVWNNPDKGLIMGKIEEIKSKNEIIIKDYNNKKWNILITEGTIIKNSVNININSIVKIVGKKINDITLEAIEIRPEIGKMKNRLTN